MKKILLTIAFITISTQAIAYDSPRRTEAFEDLVKATHRLADEEDLGNKIELLDILCLRRQAKRNKEFCAELEAQIKEIY